MLIILECSRGFSLLPILYFLKLFLGPILQLFIVIILRPIAQQLNDLGGGRWGLGGAGLGCLDVLLLLSEAIG